MRNENEKRGTNVHKVTEKESTDYVGSEIKGKLEDGSRSAA